MEFSIKPAEISEKETIFGLLQSYLTELSQFPDENPDYKDENGIYQYPYLDPYWQEDDRFPYLFYADDRLAGFSFVRKVRGKWQMAEFYVSPEFRRRGLAMKCAEDIFRIHAGRWAIRFNKHNNPSRQLWKKLADKLAEGDIEEGEADGSHDYIGFSIPR
jgi:predicted acetyltransferase